MVEFLKSEETKDWDVSSDILNITASSRYHYFLSHQTLSELMETDGT
jgi:hypothetical protein